MNPEFQLPARSATPNNNAGRTFDLKGLSYQIKRRPHRNISRRIVDSNFV